jgi:molecular chaperone GrpE (heat shock protein)
MDAIRWKTVSFVLQGANNSKGKHAERREEPDDCSTSENGNVETRIELMEKCRIELIDRLKRQKAQYQEQLAATTNKLTRLQSEYDNVLAREAETYAMQDVPHNSSERLANSVLICLTQ